MKKQRKLRLRRIAERSAARRREKEGVTLEGVIHITPGGFGFLTPENGGAGSEDIFVPAKFTGNALDGDQVRIKLMPPRSDHPEDLERGPVGKVLEVLHRERETMVAQLLPGSFVSPLNNRLPEFISIHGSRRGARRGDWVKIRCETGRDGEVSGTIQEVIGRAGEISGDLDAIMTEFGLPGKYSAEEEAAAAGIIPADIPRTDCRDLMVLTIDPFDAKDFDDALSVTPNSDGTYEVGIHIADVAAFIRPKDQFDRAAARRGFSCYLPGRTLPMLPAGLTAKISMQQDQDSLAHSVFLTVDEEGQIISGRRLHTLIRVTRRLDYDEVQNFLENDLPGKNWDSRITEQLVLLDKVVARIRAYREKTEEFIELPLPEVRVICDEKNNVITGMEKRFSRRAEQLVEECMLAANQFVGKEMPQKSVAGIYRVHPEMEAEKAMEFTDTVKEAFGLSAGDITNRSNCRKFIAGLPDDETRPLILSMLLRSMARASYSVKGELHFALGKTFYAHFTSPIRRYTDLTVHQQLWNADLNQRTRPAASLEKVAAYCSEIEENIDNACYTANDRLKIRIVEEIMAKDPSTRFECLVTRVLNSAVQVELPEFAVYAYISHSDLRMPLSTVKIGMKLEMRGDKLNFQSKR